MKYVCDTTLPTEARYLSPKYRALSRKFDVYKVEPAYFLEVIAFLRTPGFLAKHIGAMMHWSDARIRLMVGFANDPRLAQKVQPLVHTNMLDVQVQDGLGFLRAMQDGNSGKFPNGVPLWTTMALQSLKRTDAEVSKMLGITVQQVQRWRNAREFDPLTGDLLPSARAVGNAYKILGPRILGVR